MGKVGQWLQVIGNLGLIAGLVLVAMQLNQTHELMRAEHGSRFYEHRMNFDAAAIGENYADVLSKAELSPETLTPSEIVILHHALDYKVNEISRNAYLVGQGILREDPFLVGVETGYPEFTNNVVSRYWWKQRFGNEPQAGDPLWQQVIAQQVETTSGRSLGDLIQSLYASRESP